MPTRRTFLHTMAGAASALTGSGLRAKAAPTEATCPKPHPLVTAANDFYDVSRGNPKPFTLEGDALAAARLTPETWRLEIVADPFTDALVKEPVSVQRQFSVEGGTALDLPALMRLAEKHRVRYLKAMQCLNIAEPLGQGVWEGVPLREVLALCGTLKSVRRVYYHGFHNDDPKQLFQSSLSYAQAMETAPGDPPVFLAYRLNGEPIPLKRGGPVRMIVPWAHGFKSIKWLQRISLTNDFRLNDTYANANNDPESPLKTAAYVDARTAKFAAGTTVFMTGQVISGYSGLERVEYWLRSLKLGDGPIGDEDPAWLSARWLPCEQEPEPTDWSAVLPAGVSPRDLVGFDGKTGRARTWPLRYGMCSWSVALRDLAPGAYEFRARAVDLNGFAQPQPRPILKSGRNGVQMHRFEVV